MFDKMFDLMVDILDGMSDEALYVVLALLVLTAIGVAVIITVSFNVEPTLSAAITIVVVGLGFIGAYAFNR